MQPGKIFESPFTLALGGGGARGLAHIGVLRALENEGIFPSLIVGSSMGAIIGAMYSQLRDSFRVEGLVKELLHRDCFTDLRLDLMPENSQPESHRSRRHLVDYLRRGLYFSRVARRAGAIDNSILVHFLSRLLKDEDIRETNIPFAAVGVSLATGEEVVLDQGPIIRAAAASSAIPGVITPVEINGERLIDGSVLQVVPVAAAKSLSKYPVLAVDVSKDIAHEAPPKTGLDVLIRADLIANRRLNQRALTAADVVLNPEVGLADWSDFHAIDMLIAAGRDAATSFPFRDTPEDMKAEARRFGLRVERPQLRKRNDELAFYQFTDPQNNGTFTVRSGEDLKTALDKHRAKPWKHLNLVGQEK